ncbi:MAG: CRISPR-associated protein, partial [Bacilli bacterium]|nr:CRISPR-associated protein [Bacilli bacterium]
EKLKEALRNGASFYDSVAKAGVENEVLFWVQLKPESKQVLPSFVELISVNKGENDTREIDFSKVKALLSNDAIKKQIEKIEVYYNSVLVNLKNLPDGTIESPLN